MCWCFKVDWFFHSESELLCASPMLKVLKEQQLYWSTYNIYLYNFMKWCFFAHRMFFSGSPYEHLSKIGYPLMMVLLILNFLTILNACGVFDDVFITHYLWFNFWQVITIFLKMKCTVYYEIGWLSLTTLYLFITFLNTFA